MPSDKHEYHDDHVWDPMPIPAVVELLSGLPVPWWIAGGYAIELFVGKRFRGHGDTDVLIRRCDPLRLQDHLRGWDLYRATCPGLQPWADGEYLEGQYRDIWCRQQSELPWRLQLMLLDTQDDQWIFKRDPTIRGNLADIGMRTPEGVPYLAPQIQLLYKARTEILEKDQIDFNETMPLLSENARRWLLAMLVKRFPEGHCWIDSLELLN